MIECQKPANVLHLRRLKRTDKKENPTTTIAIGMRVQDGIVIAADRLLSTERHQFEDDKLTLYPLNNGVLFFAFADSPVTAKEVRQKIEARIVALGDDAEIGIPDVQRMCESVINEIYANRMGVMPLQMLIAAVVAGEDAEMWFYDGAAGFNLAGQFEILGVGDSSLIRYLKTAYSWKDSIETAQDFAIYLVHQAGEFIPGCKGIDLMFMKHGGGDWGWPDSNKIAARLEKMTAREKNQLRKIITG